MTLAWISVVVLLSLATPAASAPCTGVTCPVGWTAANTGLAALAPGAIQNTGSCCVQSCDSFQCPPGFIINDNANTIAQGATPTTACCTPACSTYTCMTAGSVLLPNAAQITAATLTDAVCCIAVNCGLYNCPVNYVNKVNDMTIVGQDTATCCDPACSLYQCPTNTIPILAPASVSTASSGGCCVPACSLYQCPGGAYAMLPTAASIALPAAMWNPAAPAGFVLTIGPVGGVNPLTTCCGMTCSGWTQAAATNSCPVGTVLQGAVIGADPVTCCAPLCYTYSCPTNYILTATATTDLGQDTATCCVMACSGYQCPAGYSLIANAAQVAGPLTAVCCTPNTPSR